MFPKPPQPNHDHNNVDETKVSNNGHEIHEQLLVRLENLEVDAVRSQNNASCPRQRHIRIQTRLGRRADAKEVAVDDADVSARVQDDYAQEAHEEDVDICTSTSAA